jgi:hypothetical protein
MTITTQDIGHTTVALKSTVVGGEHVIAFAPTNADGTAQSDQSPLTPVATAAVAGSQIAKASAGTLYGFNVAAGASAGFVMLFDSATVPAEGAVTPKKVFQLAANATLDRSWDRGLVFSTGIVIVFSTTGPYTKTISNTAFIESEIV